MSDAFPGREKAFEDKWAHDEEMRFRVLARRNRLLGEWAARESGMSGQAAEDYARSVVQAELSRNGDDAVFNKIKADFAARGIARTDHLIRRKMDDFLQVAKREVMKES